MSVLPKEVQDMVGIARFYVVFPDGSWRTCSDEQWKSEQLWKLKPTKTFWFGGAEQLCGLELVWQRYLSTEQQTPDNKPSVAL